MLFVLNRETGRPVFPVEERPVPASDIPLERASRTQPFTAATPPLSPHRFTVDQVWGVTDADRAACRAVVEGLRNEGIFTPPSVRGTLVMPSNIGGAHWGGVAIDPEREIAIVPVNRLAAMVQLIPREGFDLEQARAAEQRLGDDFEYNMMRGTPLRHAATSAAGAVEAAVHAAAVRRARRHRPQDGRPPLGGAARLVRERARAAELAATAHCRSGARRTSAVRL